MLVISSSEFRTSQARYFDRIDKGEQIVIQRRNGKAYTFTPVSEDDLYFTPEMIADIEESMAQARRGEVTTIRGIDELDKFLESL
jgi:PHD/YefM family antitoxin component YafN of YafNO toxin-antitoxin module